MLCNVASELPERGIIEEFKRHIVEDELQEKGCVLKLTPKRNYILSLQPAEQFSSVYTTVLSSSQDAIISENMTGTPTSSNKAAEIYLNIQLRKSRGSVPPS